MKRSDMIKLVECVYYGFGQDATVIFLDKMKKLGFYNATVGGISFSMKNLVIPEEKDSHQKKEKDLQKQQKNG
jgi:DNA-directed RNA polymerase subunit beta'